MKRQIFVTFPLVLGFLGLALTLPSAIMAKTPKRPNVLFIVADDLRPELKCYGVGRMVTPNIDRLSEQGVLFERAYCNNPVCGASRASLLKGLRPTVNRFFNTICWAKKDAPNVPSIPMTFKQHGYHTASFGKVYHHQGDDLEAWSEPNWRLPGLWWALPENQVKVVSGHELRGPAYEMADKPEEIYPGYITCTKTIEAMRRLAKQDKPFFLACGFWKPHLPFVAPKKYWDLYPEDEVKLADNMFFPRDLPKAFQFYWNEVRQYRSIPRAGPVSGEVARNLIRGYSACVSLTDAQIGRLMDELKRLGLADNTIVVLLSDHGWQLGEHGFWSKNTSFEVATRAPLIIVAPGVNGKKVCHRLVEYIDIYPTLCELAGLPLPDHLDGKSMVPLLKNVQTEHKEAIYTLNYRGGQAVRTDKYRYMEMRSHGGKGDVVGVGMFDLEKDPDENQNVAEKPEYAAIRKKLKTMLNEVRTNSKKVVHRQMQSHGQTQENRAVSKGYPAEINRDASWLLCRAKQIVKNARRVAHDGTEVWPPAGLQDFYHDRTYPRDFYYLVDACPECFTDSQLEKAIELFFKHQQEDGRIPNLVYLNGKARYILHDNSQFLVNLVHLYVLGSPKQEPTQAKLDFFLKHADDLQRAMAWIPLDPQTGLVNGHYGFNDTIKALEGDLFTSLLYFEAAGKLKELYTKANNPKRAEQWQKSQDKMKAAIQKLYDEQGFFYTSIDKENHLPFVWGSAFAVYIGATSEEQTHAIGIWLRDNYDKYIQRGQVRHFPKPLHWNNTTFEEEVYQNGGYWATPFAWVNHAIRNVDPQLADQMLADIAKDFQRYGINEAVNFEVDYVNRAGHAGEYCASLAPLIIYRQLGANFNREYKNLALSSNGGKATASSTLDDGRRDEHKVEHLNDGLFGNKKSWIASKSDKSPWLQIELAEKSQIDMIVFGRDNWSAKIIEGHHPNHTGWDDRDIESFTIQVSFDGTKWSEPIHADHSFAGLEAGQNHVIKLDKTISCKFIRMNFQPNTACIDEFEVFGQPSSEQ